MQPFTLLIKPSGSNCNIDCKYCFYKSRSPEVGQGRQRMNDEVLERLIRDYVQLDFPEAGFAWQGGEPTLMGLEFYEKVIEMQKKYRSPKQQIVNSLQTNGILLNDKWCKFLHENNFLLGISIDGPKEFHDLYRIDNSGQGTFEKVIAGIKKCQEYKVEFNTLTLLNAKNIEYPEEIFNFLMELGVKFMQFIPCVEIDPITKQIADFSITPEQYGEFLCKTFDIWRNYGPKNLSMRDFDSILSYYFSGRHNICTYENRCSQYVVIEHNGDAFCCDFFVESKWRLGNILETPIEKLALGATKLKFSRAKQNLSNKCLICRYLSVCRGGCMKNRIASGEVDFGHESYFCDAYKRFFGYSAPGFLQIAAQIKAEMMNYK
jgi:uncharacterized protein